MPEDLFEWLTISQSCEGIEKIELPPPDEEVMEVAIELKVLRELLCDETYEE